MIEHWATWPVMAALLTGPRKSGRSLLGRLFVAKTGGTLADDAERGSEVELFHAWNAAQAGHRPLLIIADAAPPEWQVRLPDLRSRLAATPVLRIGPPDDTLVGDLLGYLLDRRELDARPDLIAWVVKRIERSHLAVMRVIDRLEEDADQRRTRRLSIPAARAALTAAGLLQDRHRPREADAA
jgi:chromosomal replication initiation ATPase DnaA